MIAGRYSLQREIGRGGMGTVWLAHDELLDRPVALKRIGMMPGADRADLARAEREAQLAARLDHPHVVAVMDVVLDDDAGGQWLVMEYVEGTTLARLVRDQGPLPTEDAASLMWQVADALVAAHAAGIVHRDVKPSNILVDRHRRAKLTDFGIARTAADPALTQTGLVTGSPAYLAPEVAAGQRGDQAADVWSLGATLYHVLSGRPPYDIGDNVLGGLYRIVHDDPPWLPAAGRLAALLERTMVKDPAARWSMAQVRDFLAEPLDADASDADATRVIAVSQEPVTRGLPGDERRHRGALAGVLAAAALLVLIVVVVAVRAGREPDPDTAGGNTPETVSASPTQTPAQEQSQPSESPSTPSGPTAEGMETFIRTYVATVSSDPDTAFQMLTPKFQRESGGLDTYRDFWSGVGPGRILEINADPSTLGVSYRVRFQNFGTGRRPTVLDLVYDDGRYLIDGERTEGFVPAG